MLSSGYICALGASRIRFCNNFNLAYLEQLMMILVHWGSRRACLGQVQTPYFTWAESNANEGEQRTFLICIRFGSCEVRRLNLALLEHFSEWNHFKLTTWMGILTILPGPTKSSFEQLMRLNFLGAIIRNNPVLALIACNEKVMEPRYRCATCYNCILWTPT